jgi:hypothetical protein
VSTDGGSSWADAKLGPLPESPYAWRSWTFAWDARPGDHIVSSRATDATGATQPDGVDWNRGGFRNNAIHRVPVTVR